MKAKLSNGNRFVSRYISVDRWFEVYAGNGSYEGIVFSKPEGLPDSWPEWVIVRVSPEHFQGAVDNRYATDPKYPLEAFVLEPYDKNPVPEYVKA